MIYHCGPVVKKHEDGHYSFVAAGPTTSAREEPYQADVIGRYGLRGVIGKGGMCAKTLKGLQEHGAVYLHAVGGTAQVLAQAVMSVEQVFKLKEFGVPEALWVIRSRTSRSSSPWTRHGNSLHAEVEKASRRSWRSCWASAPSLLRSAVGLLRAHRRAGVRSSPARPKARSSSAARRADLGLDYSAAQTARTSPRNARWKSPRG